jgi:hypothetical protein
LFNSSSFFFQVISLSRVPPTLSHRRDLFLLSFLTLPLLLSLSLQAEKKNNNNLFYYKTHKQK